MLVPPAGAMAPPGYTGSVSCSAPKPGFATSTTPPWPQQRLNFRQAWPISDGTGVRVAVVDSGVDRSHPQLAKVHYADPRDVIGAPFPATDVDDCQGHGSAVTGIIAAPPGSSSFVGVAPGATIIPIKQTNTSSDGTGTSTGIAAGIDWAAAHGARVVNISVTTTVPSSDVEQAIERAARKNVVIVAAAGNDAQTTGVRTRAYPAAYAADHDNVIAVAAVDRSDTVADFSEVGGYITVCAPGVDVTFPAQRSGYTTGKGTSFAAPFVTGTVALMLGADPSLTAAQVRARLIATADPPPKSVPDTHYGWGIVNPYRAVTALVTPTSSPAAARPRPLPALAAPAPADRTEQHLALGLASALVLVAAFLLGGWALARRRRTALSALHAG